MTDRILRMAERSKTVDIYPEKVTPDYNRTYMLDTKLRCQAKRTAQYIVSQTVAVTEDDRFVGLIKSDGQIQWDVFTRTGYPMYAELCAKYYKQPFEKLITRDHQHANAKMEDVLKLGLSGLMDKIRASREAHAGDAESVEYLDAMEIALRGIMAWEEKCADTCAALAETAAPERAKELRIMSETVRRAPLYPAASFREAVQGVYFVFQFVPDSIGTPDRYLLDAYRRDIAAGVITRDEAKELLQELFVMINGFTTPVNLWAADKGGESHFCIGGYTKEHEDGFNELSRLILESLMELPTYRPQISLRWTEKTPREVLRYVLDCERHDFYKRVAMVAEPKRIRAMTELLGIAYEDAITYTMVGCNEPATQGGLNANACTVNAVRCLERLLHDCEEEVLTAESFDGFYALFEREFRKDMERYMEVNDCFNRYFSYDTDFLSSLFMDGPIEKAKSITAGGGRVGFGGVNLIGTGTVIDSLIVIKQFVYEDRLFSMSRMLEMLRKNWEGYEAQRQLIYRKAKYYGNDEPFSRAMAQRYTKSVYDIFHGRRDIFGFGYLIGDLIGYCPHNTWFGALMRATPDGRHDGEIISFGAGQSGGRDREGLAALLNSVAELDPLNIMTGPTVTNVMLEESLIRDDEKFEKTVDLISAYFRSGGMHIQLNYVSRKELLAARQEPSAHTNLRVRVSGFSGYFTLLDPALQSEIIDRTQVAG